MTYAQAKQLYLRALKAELKITNGPLASKGSMAAGLRAAEKTNAAIRLMASLES